MYSIGESIFPNVLKKSKVIPLFKSGEKSFAENYRPYIITATNFKIVKKLIKSRI